CRRGDVAERSGSLQIERAAVDFEINPNEIAGTEHHGSRSQKDRRGCRAASLALSRHARTRAGLRNASASRLLDRRRCRFRWWRWAVQRHPIDDVQHGNPNFPAFDVLIGIVLEECDWHDFVVVLTAVEPVEYRLNHSIDSLDAADSVHLKGH